MYLFDTDEHEKWDLFISICIGLFFWIQYEILIDR